MIENGKLIALIRAVDLQSSDHALNGREQLWTVTGEEGGPTNEWHKRLLLDASGGPNKPKKWAHIIVALEEEGTDGRTDGTAASDG